MVLSEKTLEINFVRNFRHSSHFIWQGATLRDEGRLGGGWDVGIDNLVPGRSFILQFKRPYSIEHIASNQTKFIFHINNNRNGDQNQLLSDLAQMLGRMNVFYALPCVEDLSELANPREAILWKTALADVHQTNLTNISPGTHKIEITCDNSTNPHFNGFVYSEPKELELITVRQYKEWGFDLSRLKEIGNNFSRDAIKSKRIRVKFLTDMNRV